VHLRLRWLASIGLLFAAAGCGREASCSGDECPPSLERFDGEKVEPDPRPYVLGMDVTVDALYGSIQTVEGRAGEVSVVFEPFVHRPPDEEVEALEDLESSFEYAFESEGNAIEVMSDRRGAANDLGADITVRLPPEFEGALLVHNRGDGPVDPGGALLAWYLGNATAVDVVTENGGDCFVTSDGSVFYTRAHCDGPIKLQGVSDELDVASTGSGGDVSVFLTKVGGATAGGAITSEDGSIELRFPDGSAFSVQAEIASSGRIHAQLIQSDACVIEHDSAKSQRFTCGGGGAEYVATAGTGGAGRNDISIFWAP
jgi:hypothetical protein